MTVKIELHVLQNFAPSNLNRDDTGAPKDCEFGGHRRARISSQCQKRAVRNAFEIEQLVDEQHRGARTKRLIHAVSDTLSSGHGHAPEEALVLAGAAIEGLGLARNKKGTGSDLWKTEYLLFVPRRVIGEMAALLHEHRTALTQASAAQESAGQEATKEKRKRDTKKAAEGAYPREVKAALESLLDRARNTVDVALFGRMIADKPDWNVEAACQVAQAISTNRMQMDFDFFTAVDDLKARDTAGSDMMGTVQFNSSCFYRYAVLDVDSLRGNLDGEDRLLRQAVRAFVQGFVSAIPTGKQNSMAAHNFPSYALAIIRKGGQPLSLANAFLKPARPRGEEVDLVDDSIQKLESYATRLLDVLGNADRLTWADRDLLNGGAQRIATIGDFYDSVTTRALGAAS